MLLYLLLCVVIRCSLLYVISGCSSLVVFCLLLFVVQFECFRLIVFGCLLFVVCGSLLCVVVCC